MIVLANADCRSIIKKLPDASVDLIVADPPWEGSKHPWDRHVPGWLNDLERVLKPGGSMWLITNIKHLMRVTPELDKWQYVQDVVIEHENGSGPTLRPVFRHVHTHAIQYRPKASKLGQITLKSPVEPDTGLIQRSVIEGDCNRKRWHPHEQPYNVLHDLIAASCPAGSIILDPFAGSGNVALAAHELECSTLSIEIDHYNFEAIENRLQFLKLPFTTTADPYAYSDLFGEQANARAPREPVVHHEARPEAPVAGKPVPRPARVQRPVRVQCRLPRTARQ